MKDSNKGVQGTLHKVSGPLTPDVRLKKYMRIPALILIIGIASSAIARAEDQYVFTSATNATCQMRVTFIIPGFPRPEEKVWHLKAHSTANAFDLGENGPIVSPSPLNSRDNEWTWSILPTRPPPYSNICFQLEYCTHEFHSGRASTNLVNIKLPTGKDFAATFDGVSVNSRWINMKAEQGVAPYVAQGAASGER